MKKARTLLLVMSILLLIPVGLQAQQTVTADFSWTPNPACVNVPVQFQNQSTGLAVFPWYYWDFGDGSPISYLENPSHIYAAAGTYNVLLMVQDSLNGFDSLNQQVVVTTGCDTDHFDGQVYIDSDGSGTFNGGDIPVGNQMLEILPGPIYWVADANGAYDIELQTGNYTFSIVPPNYFNVTAPAGNSVTHNALGTGQTFTTDFVLDPVGTVPDLCITMSHWPFRPGFTTGVWVSYQNVGNTIESGTVNFSHPSNLGITSSTPAASSVATGSVSFTFSNLFPLETRTIWIETVLPATVPLGTPMLITADVTAPAGDVDVANNSLTDSSVVVGSYDPNDKQVSPSFGPEGFVLPGEQLTYTIRFQNTGTDTAFTVRVADVIDPNLEITSIKMLGASHNYSMTIDENREVNWTFDNILLLDSNRNEPLSHGFIKYAIDQKPGLADFTQIDNTASIFFDFNAPIITNTTVTMINSATDLEGQLLFEGLKVFPNPTQSATYVRFDNADQQLHDLSVFDLSGRVLSQQSTRGENFRVSLADYAPGVYIYRLKAADGRTISGKITLQQ